MFDMIGKLEKLKNLKLPDWETIPDTGIYKEELMTYLRKVLDALYVVDKNVITSSMINNYVKHGYVDKPIKKRYSRSSIAQIIVIATFKQIISIEDVAKGIDIEISTFGIKEVYENFRQIFKSASQSVLEEKRQGLVRFEFSYEDHHDKVLYYLALSLFTKLYTKVVIDNR